MIASDINQKLGQTSFKNEAKTKKLLLKYVPSFVHSFSRDYLMTSHLNFWKNISNNGPPVPDKDYWQQPQFLPKFQLAF